MATETEFGLLGPMLVRRAGAVRTIPPGKQRALLAALLVNANRAVPAEELALVLWGDAPPASARVTLQNYVKRLRKALDVEGDTRIVTVAGGYLIRVDVAELDLSQFEAAKERARAAARQESWELASAELREALALWRGEPLADVPSDHLALRLGPRLAELRLQAVEARVEADLHLGRHSEVIPELWQLADAHPLRERLVALLMLALYRDGRQGDALVVYQRARRVLIEELGSEPGPELRRLHQQVLAAAPALGAPLGGRGADAPGRAGPMPAVSTHAVVPRQLPGLVRHFAGRAAELEVLTRLLDSAHDQTPGTMVISVISGTAGVGKTALAIHWAHRVAARFPDGQLYVNLHGYDRARTPVPPAEVARGLLNSLQVPSEQMPRDQDPCLNLFRSLVAGRRMLIVLDNARDTDQVRPLLPGGAGCLVLVTSRSQLASLIAAEGAHPVVLDVLTEADARELLAKHLGPGRVAAEPHMATELIALCARLPLALVIAAAQVALQRRMSLATLVSELRDARGRLDALDAGDASGSVRTAFSWSYPYLPAAVARMFRMLSLHPGPDISTAAAASLAGTRRDEADRMLRQLTRASLVTSGRPGRFAFHDLLRVYAGELADATDSREECQRATCRVLDHYLQTARQADEMLKRVREPVAALPPQPGVVPEVVSGYEEAMAWFQAERQVMPVLVGTAARAGLHTCAWQLAEVLTTFADRRGYWDSLLPVQQTALAASQSLGDRQKQAICHHRLGQTNNRLGNDEDARTHFGKALDLYRQLGDRIGQGRVHSSLGALAERQGRHRDALQHSLQALGLFRAVGDRGWQATVINNIGWCHARLGEFGQAQECARQAISLHQELGKRESEACAWDSLGYTHAQLGQYRDALACYERALSIFRQLGDRFNEADVLGHLGDYHRDTGDLPAAIENWRRALAILVELHHPAAEHMRRKLSQEGS